MLIANMAILSFVYQHNSTQREVLITILRLIALAPPQSESEQGHVVDVAWLAALVGEMEVFLKHHSSLNTKRYQHHHIFTHT